MDRREFLYGTAAGAAAAVSSCAAAPPSRPHRWIDQEACIGCGRCVEVCSMGAISLSEKSSINPAECAECGTCSRSRVCPEDAIRPGALAWPRSLRETFSNPLAEHKSTGVAGRGTEGIKTNDSSGRYQAGAMGVFVELGRPVRGARFRDVERVVKKFREHGYDVIHDNPVAELVADPRTGALKSEVLDEKVISALVEFILPAAAGAELLAMIAELDREVETVFNVSVALRAGPDGMSPISGLFPDSVFRLMNGKVNIGMAAGIRRSG